MPWRPGAGAGLAGLPAPLCLPSLTHQHRWEQLGTPTAGPFAPWAEQRSPRSRQSCPSVWLRTPSCEEERAPAPHAASVPAQAVRKERSRAGLCRTSSVARTEGGTAVFQDGKTFGPLVFSPLVDPRAANPLVSLFPPRRSCYSERRQNTCQKLRVSCITSDMQLLGRAERTRQAEMAKSSSAEGPATLSCRRSGGRGCLPAPATPQTAGGAFPRAAQEPSQPAPGAGEAALVSNRLPFKLSCFGIMECWIAAARVLQYPKLRATVPRDIQICTAEGGWEGV